MKFADTCSRKKKKSARLEQKLMYKTKLFLDKTETKLKYSWRLNNSGVRDTDSPSSQKSEYNLYSQPSIWGSCSTVLFTIEKILCISGPLQFKLMFKGQLTKLFTCQNLVSKLLFAKILLY